MHARVADARRDWLHKESTRIIRDNQAVYVEDLCIAGLGRTRLAKSVHDAGWSAFTSMLEYKARRHGRAFGKTGRFEPTSQVCSACGMKDGPKPLSVREWTCGACGTVHDRDVNAARNIVTAGRAETLNACGGTVRRGLPRPGPVKQEPAGARREPRRRNPRAFRPWRTSKRLGDPVPAAHLIADRPDQEGSGCVG